MDAITAKLYDKPSILIFKEKDEEETKKEASHIGYKYIYNIWIAIK